MTSGRTRRYAGGACAFFLALLWPGTPSRAQIFGGPSPVEYVAQTPASNQRLPGESVEQYVARLDAKDTIFKGLERKMRDGFVSQPLREQGIDLEESGLQTLRDLSLVKTARDLSSILGDGRASTDAEVIVYDPRSTNAPTPERPVLRGLDWATRAFDILDTAEKAAAEHQRAPSGSTQQKLADARAAAKMIEKSLGMQRNFPAKDGATAFMGMVVSAVTLAYAQTLDDEKERKKYRAEAADKFSQTALKASTYQLLAKEQFGGGTPIAKKTAAVASILTEVYTRLGVYAVFHYKSQEQIQQSEALQNNILHQLQYQRLDISMKRDEATGPDITGRKALQRMYKEPGGIKFNGVDADALANGLDVTAIEFDPVRGHLVLAGKKSSQTFELETFSDVLRMAIEDHEPFFSLDSSNPVDWDGILVRTGRVIREKYGDDVMRIAEQVRAANPEPVRHRGLEYYYATINDFDSEVSADAHRGYDAASKLVFSPAWLRGSSIGWMLYEADLAIKGIAAGFLERDFGIIPSPAWQMDDFEPSWLHRDTSVAGRANFELDASTVAVNGGRLDLSEVRPKLYVTERKPGTNEDLPQTPRCLAIQDHFSRHWREYVEQIPELGRLEMLYRAYVAARYLAKHHPGLAARIRQMPKPLTAEPPPLLSFQPIVIRVAYQNGMPVPVVPDSGIFYDLGGGYGGGAVFKADEKIKYVENPAAAPAGDWVSSTRAKAPANATWLEGAGGEAMVVLEFYGSDAIAPATRYWLAIGLGLLVAIIAGAGLLFRRFDWQRLTADVSCAHCARIHGRLGYGGLIADLVCAGALAYLVVLPFASAAYDQRPGPLEIAFALVLIAGAGATIMLIGGGALRLLGRTPIAASPSFFAGARITLIALAALLLRGGVSSDAIGASVIAALPPEAGERLLTLAGGAGPITAALIVGLAAAAAGLVLRWAAPLVFDSRPLVWLPSGPHQHAGSQS